MRLLTATLILIASLILSLALVTYCHAQAVAVIERATGETYVEGACDDIAFETDNLEIHKACDILEN